MATSGYRAAPATSEQDDTEAGWDSIYARGEDANAEPWSNIVSFIHRFVLPGTSAAPRLLELGCGTGANLRFAGDLGIACAGIDISDVALDLCRKTLESAGLAADLRKCPFGELPFDDDSFDCVIDRAALMFADDDALAETIDEVYRVLKPSGLFFHNTIADTPAALGMASGTADYATSDDCGPAYAKYPDFILTSALDLKRRFGDRWQIHELRRIDRTTFVPALDVTAEWELVARKN